MIRDWFADNFKGFLLFILCGAFYFFTFDLLGHAIETRVFGIESSDESGGSWVGFILFVSVIVALVKLRPSWLEKIFVHGNEISKRGMRNWWKDRRNRDYQEYVEREVLFKIEYNEETKVVKKLEALLDRVEKGYWYANLLAKQYSANIDEHSKILAEHYQGIENRNKIRSSLLASVLPKWKDTSREPHESILQAKQRREIERLRESSAGRSEIEGEN